MIEVAIPKDIREFEPTLVGPLTTRHAACITLGGILVYGGYYLEKAMGIDPVNAPFFCLLFIPFALIGWVKPYGMHFEKFIGKCIRDNFVAPAKRLYKIENMWDVIEMESEKENRRREMQVAKVNGEKYEPPKKQPFKELPKSSLTPDIYPYK